MEASYVHLDRRVSIFPRRERGGGGGILNWTKGEGDLPRPFRIYIYRMVESFQGFRLTC